MKPPNERIQAIIKKKKEDDKDRILEKGLDVDTYEREFKEEKEEAFEVPRRQNRREKRGE